MKATALVSNIAWGPGEVGYGKAPWKANAWSGVADMVKQQAEKRNITKKTNKIQRPLSFRVPFRRP
jgi:hypothetical protein